jgi:hypothetical protein
MLNQFRLDDFTTAGPDEVYAMRENWQIRFREKKLNRRWPRMNADEEGLT